MLNWIKDFLKEKTIEVRMGSLSSSTYTIEIGPHICSPQLVYVMINYMFDGVGERIYRELYTVCGEIVSKR